MSLNRLFHSLSIHPRVRHAGIVLAALACTAACGGGSSSDDNADGSGGSGGAVADTGGSSGSGTGGSGAGGTGTGGGATEKCSYLDLAPGETGPHGEQVLYASGEFGDEYMGAGVDDSYVYFVDYRTLKRVSTSGGEPEELLTNVSSASVVGDDIFSFEDTGDATSGDLYVSKLTTPHDKTLLQADVPYSRVFSDGTSAFFGADDAGIKKVTLPSGPVSDFVTGVNPNGMALSGDTLYFIDFVSSQLKSVPTAGGTPTVLTDIFWGGDLAVDGSDVYWADDIASTLRRYTEGDDMPQTLFSTTFGEDDAVSPVAKDGKVYFLRGFGCNTMYMLPREGGTPQIVGNGFDTFYQWTGINSTHAFVVGSGVVYSVPLQ